MPPNLSRAGRGRAATASAPSGPAWSARQGTGDRGQGRWHSGHGNSHDDVASTPQCSRTPCPHCCPPNPATHAPSELLTSRTRLLNKRVGGRRSSRPTTGTLSGGRFSAEPAGPAGLFSDPMRRLTVAAPHPGAPPPELAPPKGGRRFPSPPHRTSAQRARRRRADSGHRSSRAEQVYTNWPSVQILFTVYPQSGIPY